MRKGARISRWLLAGVAGLVALLFISLQVILHSPVLTRIVGRVAEELVPEGEVGFGRVRTSMLRSFPRIELTVEDFTLTYPAERYAAYDTCRTGEGKGPGTDTLAVLRELSLSVDYVAAFRGRYDVHRLVLRGPRLFGRYYGPEAANWDILPLSSGPKDTVRKALSLPDVSVGRLSLTETPYVFFATPSDSMSLWLDRAEVSGDRTGLTVDIAARTYIATRSYGELEVPLGLYLQGRLPSRADGAVEADVDTLRLRVATVELAGAGDAVLLGDSTYVRAEAAIDGSRLGDLVRLYGDNFPALKKVTTDARLSLAARAEGYLSAGSLPELSASIHIPTAYVRYEGIDRDAHVALDGAVATDGAGRLDVTLRHIDVDAGGMRLRASGSADDLLGADPFFGLDGTLSARIDTLTRLLTASCGITGTGDVEASLRGKIRRSQLDGYRFTRADLHGRAVIDGLDLRDAPDSLSATVGHADILLASMGNRIDSTLRPGSRVLGLAARIDTIDVSVGEDVFLRGGGLSLLAQNGAEILNRQGTERFHPLVGQFQADRLRIQDGDSLRISVRGTEETFRIIPGSATGGATTLRLTSSNERIGIRQAMHRVGVRKLGFQATARMHQRDTVRRRARRERDRTAPRSGLPEWLQDEEFRQHDIDIRLGASMARYFREWDIEGALSMERAGIMTPSFPLRTRVSDVRGSFTNDRVSFDNITVTAGGSDISADATLSGLRGTLLRHGVLRLDANVISQDINADELLQAVAAGKVLPPPAAADSLSDDAYQEMLTEAAAGSVPDSTASRLFVVPANLIANVSLGARRIRYDSLTVNWTASDIAVRQRCVQVTNTVATSNMGDIYFEGFYSSRTRSDIQAGFDVNFVNITADKVIGLIPAMDTIMPLLKSFKGELDCELAVTTALDPDMNLILPTMDGILKVSGRNLKVENSPQFTKVARLLRFRDNKMGRVDRMSVEGMLRDNTLEVFPFVLDLDRYTMAASGLQHLDESFQYHVSVIRSPLLVKFGINLWGEGFDSMKFAVGKARYTDTRVPVFTRQLDTVQVNLVNSIRNIFDIGVDRAVAANRDQRIVAEEMEKLHYDADPLTDSLSTAERIVLEMAGETVTEETAVEDAVEEVETDVEVDAKEMLREARRQARKERREARKEE